MTNLFILLRNRRKEQIYLVSNDSATLMAAKLTGFCVVPIANSLRSLQFELHLAERYLLINRVHKFSKVKNTEDFNFLLKAVNSVE